jgi:ABC-type enterochelin transport system ATPase subunit
MDCVIACAICIDVPLNAITYATHLLTSVKKLHRQLEKLKILHLRHINLPSSYDIDDLHDSSNGEHE